MEVLPDVVGVEPVIVFCGQAGAESSRTRDHYYESPDNSFWGSLHLSGLSPRRLQPEENRFVVELGVRRPGLGPAPFDVAGAAVFVLPGTSGANQRRDYDGRPTRLVWWRDLAALAEPDLAAR